MKKLLIAMLIGAALAYLFDPDNGVRRRDDARRKVESFRKTAPEPEPAPAPAAPIV